MYIDLAVNQIVFGRFCLLWARSRDMAKILFGITGTQVGPASSFYMGAGQLDTQYLHTTGVPTICVKNRKILNRRKAARFSNRSKIGPYEFNAHRRRRERRR